MNFLSDTCAPAHPAVLEAVARANAGFAPSYGADALSGRVGALLRDLFETDIEVMLVSSGTAANALALSLLCSPLGAILCHQEAHIARDERGAPEFFTGGGSLQLLPGARGLICEDALAGALQRRNPAFVHETPADALSLTNLTECGAAYRADDIGRRAELARAHGLGVHLDGARLANALVGAGQSAADMTWRAGVDVVTFGFTKTGAMGCEAIVLFGSARSKLGALQARAKRAGHLPPKMRFLSAQAEAMLTDELWRDLAGRANRAAQALADGLSGLPGIEFSHLQADAKSVRLDGNELFVRLPEPARLALEAAGAGFYPWLDGSRRLVTSWATTEAEVNAFVQTARGALVAQAPT